MILSRKSAGRKPSFEPIARGGRRTPRLVSCRTQGPADFPEQDARRADILLAYHGQKERDAMAAILIPHGYNVTPCADGRAALKHVAMGHFDLVVTGIIMPQTDGLELMRNLRRRNPGLPVVAVAEGADRMNQIYLRSATLSGAVSTHTSPIDPGVFLSSVDWILKGRTDVIRDVVW